MWVLKHTKHNLVSTDDRVRCGAGRARPWRGAERASSRSQRGARYRVRAALPIMIYIQ